MWENLPLDGTVGDSLPIERVASLLRQGFQSISTGVVNLHFLNSHVASMLQRHEERDEPQARERRLLAQYQNLKLSVADLLTRAGMHGFGDVAHVGDQDLCLKWSGQVVGGK